MIIYSNNREAQHRPP